MNLEFFWAGTSTPAPVDMTKLLMGGQREFTGVGEPFGVAEFTLLSGGAAGSAVAPTFADPDISTTDSDSADGIAGLGTTPIIELDDANFGVANNTAYNEARSSYVSVGALSVRDWTILDWGGATGDTLRGTSTARPPTILKRCRSRHRCPTTA